MHYFFLPDYIAIVVIASIWIHNQFSSKTNI
jgi:hypothetical protein